MERVSIVVGDVSNNALGRAYLLGQLMSHRVEPRLIGPMFGDGVWAPLREGASMPIEGIPSPDLRFGEGNRSLRRLEREIKNDLVYVAKPFATTMRAAMKATPEDRRLLDIDDWEMGFVHARRSQTPKPVQWIERITSRRGVHPRRTWSVEQGERLASAFPVRTVSNRFLEARFGGELIPHVRDTDVFDPKRHDGGAVRSLHGLPDGPLVLFQGTPRAHKGLDDLIDAMALLDPAMRAHLLVVGVDDTPFCHHMVDQGRSVLGDRFHTVGMRPFAKMPGFLAAADVVALPQQAGPATIGQMPAKVFDAMAMARPIVSTAISDLPEVLEGCGRIVPPDDPGALSTAIMDLLTDSAAARRLGAAARRRCIERYSHDAARKTMDRILDRIGVA